MQAGKLDRRITFQRRSAALDVYGTEDQNTWTDVFTCAARVAMQGGREFQRAQIIMADIEQLFVTRYCSQLSDITEKDRISYGGKIYDIHSVNNVMEKRVELQFLCTLHR